MTKNYKDKLFNTLWVKHPATFEEMSQYKRKGLLNIVDKKNRHIHWYCVCIECQKVHIVASNYLARKKCQCRKNR